jgi:hypothetical protein
MAKVETMTSVVIEHCIKCMHCGTQTHGIARIREDCAVERLVTFSCKGRGVFRSCNARRMVEVAAHLNDHVLPPLPVLLFLLLGICISACTAQPSSRAAHEDTETTGSYSNDSISGGWDADDSGPLIDHHVHAFSPAVGHWLERELDLPPLPPLGVEELIHAMDDDKVARAALLSNAYFFAHSTAKQPEDLEAFRAENDRVALAVAKHPGRLVGFCGINPIAESALPEMERCAEPLPRGGVHPILGRALRRGAA